MDEPQSPTQAAPAPAPASSPAGPPFQFRRPEGFFSCYANNVQLESTSWDLKLVFGVIDQRDAANPVVEQQVSMNISWPEVKVLIYLMRIHLALYEKENGKIKIPAAGIPPEVPTTIPPQFDNPAGREGFALIRKMREEFVANMQER